jgi:hypothetical protein
VADLSIGLTVCEGYQIDVIPSEARNLLLWAPTIKQIPRATAALRMTRMRWIETSRQTRPAERPATTTAPDSRRPLHSIEFGVEFGRRADIFPKKSVVETCLPLLHLELQMSARRHFSKNSPV